MSVSVTLWRSLSPTPWANGRGVTRELARHPVHGDFDWRLSAAEVPDAAPFSSLPGLTRSLGVLAGGALDLTIDGARHRLEIGSAPLSFDGGATTSAAPVDTPVIDLNLMVRTGRVTGSLASIATGGHLLPSGFTAIVAIVDGVTIEIDGTGYAVDALDSLVRQADATATATITAPAASGTDPARAVVYLAQIG